MAVKTKVGFLAAALMVGSMVIPAFAQDQGAGGGGGAAGGGGGGGGRRGQGGGGGGGGGNFDPAAMRQRIMDRLRDDLGVTDDEIKAMYPKIEHVQQLARDSSGGGGFGFGGRGRGGPGGGGQPGGAPQSEVQTKQAALQTVIDNKDAKPEEIKAALEALRAAKAKATTDLAKARTELRGLLTQRQEAVLVIRGTLD